MNDTAVALPDGFVWRQRPFPDANFLLLTGDAPALVDSGFVAGARSTVALAHEHCRQVAWVVNTHWHSDHVGGNALLQAHGTGVIGSREDADALDRGSPGCCVAEYLDQPVPRYTVDRRVGDGDRLPLGNTQWTVLAVPGHTPGHLALWNADHRILVAGDTLSSYDVGWVNIMREGTGALDRALTSLLRLRDLDARLILPGHGPIITDPATALDKAVDRIRRQRADLDLAVGYGARRILAFALMIRGGMRIVDLDEYLTDRGWTHDAAELLGITVEEFIRSLVDGMVASGALTVTNGTVRAATEALPADPRVFDLPFPRHWPARR